MSISNEFTAPGPRQRPGVVTFGAYAQFAIFVLSILATVATVVAAESFLPVVADEFRTNAPEGMTAQDADTFLSISRAVIYVISSVIPLYSLVVAIMGFFVLKGRNGARVTTWVLAGVGLTCTGLSTFTAPLSMMSSSQPPGGSDSISPEYAERLEAAVPLWTDVVSIGATVLAAVLYLVIIVLLALPVSNEYFRKRGPAEQLPGAAFPAPPPPPNAGGPPPPPTDPPHPPTTG